MKKYPKEIEQQLDFDFIKKQIAQLCLSEAAQLLATNMSTLPKTEILAELHCTHELLKLLEEKIALPSIGFKPIKAHAKRLLVKGVVLEEEAFTHIRSTHGVYESLFLFIRVKRQKLPQLFYKIQATEPQAWIVNAINSIIDERGQVKSNASKELQYIRQQLGKKRAAAERIFSRALKKYKDRGLLADFDETISENRRVLAIQSSFKGQANGIFHGSSSKNSIVYVEPAETVEVNNEIAQLVDDERHEIRKILKELTARIQPQASFLQQMERKLVNLDFIHAKTQFAYREKCTLPILNQENKTIKLVNAYNPVLQILNKEKKKDTIALNLSLHPGQRLMVISGPNAGGKSIALKTLGILCLMLQSGVLIPVDAHSELFFFNKLFADIGDSQSIENELSTYSSKLQKMNYFLQNADDNTLLLVDEFGSGSDPELGSALAQVFLEKLNSYHVYGIFTTHYNAIKSLAANLPGVQNAAMLFDKRTFSPEYLLEVGNPGSSYTFEVAAKSGIPKHLVQEARSKTAQQTLEVDALLVKLQDDKLQLEKRRNRLNQDLQKIRVLEASKTETIQKLEEKLEKQSKLNETNDRILYWGLRFQKMVEAWMKQQNQKDKKAVIARFIGILNERSSEVQVEEKTQLSKAQKKRAKKLEELKQTEVAVGDEVQIISSGIKGRIAEIKKNKYLITLGPNMNSLVSRAQFISAKAQLEAAPKVVKRKKTFTTKATPKNKKGKPPKLQS